MTSEYSKHDHVLAGLVFSLQAAAMQQLGKIQNPMTGEVAKDLDQAKGTIDMLEMLKVKCRTDTPDEILRMMDSAVMDLQLNYMDERKKAAQAPADGQGAEQNDEPPGTADAEADDARPAGEGDDA
jgi:hypothetical protein